MKKIARIIAVALAITTLVVAFAGCTKAKEAKDILTRYEALKNPADITDADEFIKEYEAYTNLYVEAAQLYSENIKDEDAAHTFTTINNSSNEWNSKAQEFPTLSVIEATTESLDRQVAALESVINAKEAQ